MKGSNDVNVDRAFSVWGISFYNACVLVEPFPRACAVTLKVISTLSESTKIPTDYFRIKQNGKRKIENTKMLKKRSKNWIKIYERWEKCIENTKLFFSTKIQPLVSGVCTVVALVRFFCIFNESNRFLCFSFLIFYSFILSFCFCFRFFITVALVSLG